MVTILIVFAEFYNSTPNISPPPHPPPLKNGLPCLIDFVSHVGLGSETDYKHSAVIWAQDTRMPRRLINIFKEGKAAAEPSRPKSPIYDHVDDRITPKW